MFWKHWFKDVKQVKSARRNQAVRRLSMQPLESRQMMAVLPELVREINLAGGANPSDLTEVNGTIYFVADTAGTGRELWKSDGTSARTEQVIDLNPGASSSTPMCITNIAGVVHFAADDGASGVELRRSNGTTAGNQ
jgi:ELWxxDGT repeat protein